MSNKQQDLYIPPRPRCEEMNFSEYDEDYIITVPQGIRENSQKMPTINSMMYSRRSYVSQ